MRWRCGFSFEEDEISEPLGIVEDYWRIVLLGAVGRFYGCKVVRTVGDRKRATIRGLPSAIRETKISFARIVHSIVRGARSDMTARRLFGNILAEELMRMVNRVKPVVVRAEPWEVIAPSSRVAEVEREESDAETRAIMQDSRAPAMLSGAHAFARLWLHYFSQVKESGTNHLLLPPWRPTMEEFFAALGEVANREMCYQIWCMRFASAWNQVGIVHYRQAPRSRWSLLEI